MISLLKDRKKEPSKEERELELKKALAEKCARLGDEYVSHESDTVQYTVLTVNGKKLRIRKEEIVLEGPAD